MKGKVALISKTILNSKIQFNKNDDFSYKVQNLNKIISDYNVKPFLKWAGGKGQLLREIEKQYPFHDYNIKKYVEPFVGGGAVFFDIINKYDLEFIYISDTNNDLINAYRTIKYNKLDLIKLLKIMEKEYLNKDKEHRKKYYLEKREKYNDIKIKGSNEHNVLKASYLIFLNKTCFNGLYRVNSKGLFNVPMGTYKNPQICDEKNIIAISDKLKRVKIECADFKDSEDFIDENTFVYFDPPYRPITKTANFTAYTSNEFNDNNQIELANFVKKIDKKGAKFVLSNSDPKNTDDEDDFFDDLYSEFKIRRVDAKRMINSNSKKRGNVKELLISNFWSNELKELLMEKKNFTEWLSNFRNSISDYKYYINFEKIYDNVDKIKVELNILNSLIGSKDIENEFIKLIKNYPEIIKCIPILLAVRLNEIYCQDDNGGFLYKFNVLQQNVEEKTMDYDNYVYFMKETGLFDLLENHIVNNLIDYVTGVETGLDSNGRKNRGGHLMENLVENYIKRAGFRKNENYFKEMYISEISSKWNIDLSNISNKGKMEKRFDFVLKTSSMIYAIETNFYSGGGSKLNETARSYKTLAVESQDIDGFTFVWITDGKGWFSAKNNLEETFDIMENIYNIKELEDGIINEVFR